VVEEGFKNNRREDVYHHIVPFSDFIVSWSQVEIIASFNLKLLIRLNMLSAV